MSLTKFSFLFPFAHTIDLSRVNVRVCKGKGKFTLFFVWAELSVQNYRRMETQLNSIISATFLSSSRNRILKINFCKYSICSVYIVKSLSFFRYEGIFIIFPRKYFYAADASSLHWPFTANRFYRPGFYFFIFY